MSDATVPFTAPIALAGFCGQPLQRSCAAVVLTADDTLTFLSSVGDAQRAEPHKLASLPLPPELQGGAAGVLRHLTWLSPSLLALVGTSATGDVLWCISLAAAPTEADVKVR